MGSKSVSQILKVFIQTGNITFMSSVVVFLVDMLNKKAPFPTKKTSAVKSETRFGREAIKV